MVLMKDEVFQAVQLLGAATANQVLELLPNTNVGSVPSALLKAFQSGLLVREKLLRPGRKGIEYAYKVNPDPAKTPPPKPPKAPTPVGLEMRLSDALQRVAVLEAWKAAAIARYPNLGVDPKVLEARAIVAKVFKDTHDLSRAQSVEAGQNDTSPIMLATLAALGA